MNGSGEILSEDIINPIGILPFVDISVDKDSEFFVQHGNDVTDFALEIGALLSDLSNIHRLQGYAQAVISSSEKPKDLLIGPNRVLYLEKDSNGEGSDPTFQFVSPNPDLQSGLEMIDTIIKLFLTTKGLDQSTVTGKGDAQKFSSGVDRFLAMVDKFEASQEDISLFRKAEMEVFNLMVSWSNLLQGVTDEQFKLEDKLNIARVNDKAEISIKFNKPQMLQSEVEKEDSVIKKMDKGLMSRVEAIMEIREVEREEAEKIVTQIDEDKVTQLKTSVPQFTFTNPTDQQEDVEDGSTEIQEE
jgi:hypothetical protein